MSEREPARDDSHSSESAADPRNGKSGADENFDWELPRWREGAGEESGEAGEQADVERDRRYRDHGTPRQRGAIDERGSVGGKDDAAGAA